MDRVLIVDNEEDVCTALKLVLQQNGFKVDYFAEPILALDNFKAGTYDLLLLDIKMPDMDGFQLYQEMKKIDSNAKICFLTASELYHEELRKQQGHNEFEAVAIHLFLRKPINNEDLIRQINRIMRSN
jgi:DNA-binding response OmpR family regulator